MAKFDKNIVVTACILAAATIALGAFGAHGLQSLVGESAVETFETGVQYQMYHTLALLIIGFATAIPQNIRKWIFVFFLSGILIFSGSLYLLVLGPLLEFDATKIGFVTPLGGLLLIFGWIRLAYAMFTEQ